MPLKQLHIEQVKSNFRVVGISGLVDASGSLAVGAIYRGNNELDGVTCKQGDSSLAELISNMLMESSHLGQIRLILLGDDALAMDEAENLWVGTGKPVLMSIKPKSFDPRFMLNYRERVFFAAGIDEESAKRVLDVVMGEEGSEALRTADIILKALVNLHNV